MTVVDAGLTKELDVEVVVPVQDMSVGGLRTQTTPQHAMEGQNADKRSIWPAIHPRILELVQQHRSTIVFVNARRLAEGLAEMNASAVDPAAVETNMAFLDLKPFGLTAPELSAALRERGILTLGFPGYGMRLVTHRDVAAADIEVALNAFRECLLR